MTTPQLESLYPFLHGKARDGAREREALLESIRQKAAHSVDEKRRFFAANDSGLLAMAEGMAGVYRGGGVLFAMGNGGSSCDAAHFAVEFQHPVTAGRPPLPAVNLCADTALTTAVGNDAGIAEIFARQIEAHATARDGLVGFSTSGNSTNLARAYEVARGIGLKTFGLAGGDGGDMNAGGLVERCLVVETDSIHRVQEVHVACYHILWDIVHTLLADSRGRPGAGP
ncbi:MAG TPA: phosphoheptose isomerase [Halieaceae bacterium]|nr:phosphoheptose isomerase [Halieaceae bacterium]